jgi:sec-independent protein translocase protein TatC
MLYVKVALLAGAFLAAPVVLYQLRGGSLPGLYERERHHAAPFVVFGLPLFFSAAAHSLTTSRFRSRCSSARVGKEFQPMITAERYLGFMMTVILRLG